MHIIHFTQNAADPLFAFNATGADSLPLAAALSNAQISCLHLKTGAAVDAPSLTHAVALLVVHGKITVTNQMPRLQANIHAGMGCVFEAGEGYRLESKRGAIVLIVEADHLIPHARGISHPERIAGAQWPGDSPTIQTS